MKSFFEILELRNTPLFYFGAVNLILALLFILLASISKIKVTGVNAWFKPLKFALSIATFSWTMAWYTAYLNAPKTIELYNWVVIIFLGFEIFYISIQAARGQMSHHNISTPLYSFWLFLMIVSAVIPTLWTGYIGTLFFLTGLPDLPDYYLLSIKMGIIYFVLFAFEGPMMGARRAHTVGAEDGGEGLPLVNWSKQHGDLRIAHFIGMHALQILPLLSFFIFRNILATAIISSLYGVLAVYSLIVALKGKPLIR